MNSSLKCASPILSDQTHFGFYEFNRRAGDFAIAMALVTYTLSDGVIVSRGSGLAARRQVRGGYPRRRRP